MMQSHQFKINHTLIAVADGDGGSGEAVNNVKKLFTNLYMMQNMFAFRRTRANKYCKSLHVSCALFSCSPVPWNYGIHFGWMQEMDAKGISTNSTPLQFCMENSLYRAMAASKYSLCVYVFCQNFPTADIIDACTHVPQLWISLPFNKMSTFADTSAELK